MNECKYNAKSKKKLNKFNFVRQFYLIISVRPDSKKWIDNLPYCLGHIRAGPLQKWSNIKGLKVIMVPYNPSLLTPKLSPQSP